MDRSRSSSDSDNNGLLVEGSLTLEDFFEHHGIKGMKWGIRKENSSGSRPSVSEDAAKAKAHRGQEKQHGIGTLSNDDLQQVITRMNLEKQFNALTPSAKKAFKKFLTNLIINESKKHAQNTAKDLAKQIPSLLAK